MKDNSTLYFSAIATALLAMYFSLGFPLLWRAGLLAAGATYIYLNFSRLVKQREYFNALKGSAIYSISYDDLPTEKMLVGKGFLWMPEHTMMANTLISDKKLLEQGEHLGGLSFLHGIGFKEEKDIYKALKELTGHVVIIGSTQVGKTRSYEVFIAQAIKRGETTIVFDPKGDHELLNRVVEISRQSGRQENFAFFALPYPKFSAHYNPLRNFTIPNEIPDRVAMMLPAGGDSEPFRAFSWQVINVITNALLFLGLRPNIRLLSDYSLAKTSELTKKCITEAFRKHGLLEEIKLLENTPDNDEKEYMKTYARYPEVHHNDVDQLILLAQHPHEHFQKMIASLTPLLTKLSGGEIGTLLSEPSGGSANRDIDWERAVKNQKIVYMLFGSLLMRDTAKSVARMAIQDLTSFIGSRYCFIPDRKPINLFIDEFTEVFDQFFINLLNKAGGAEVRIFLASQSVADLESELKSAAKAQQIFDNLNTKVWLRVSDMATAKVFSDAAGTATLQQENIGFSVSPDISDNDVVFKSSYSQGTSVKVAPLVDPSYLLKLPKGQGFILSGGRVYKIRIPLLPPCSVDYYREKGIVEKER